MRERIIKFLEVQGLSPARFADEIGVQRSSISHIISGRNNPSFDFIIKILTKYKFINAEWLMRGSGEMFSTEEPKVKIVTSSEKVIQGEIFSQFKETLKLENKNTLRPEDLIGKTEVPNTNKKIDKVILFYDDKTFTAFSPEN